MSRFAASVNSASGPWTPLPLKDARRLAKGYFAHYNNVRLNSAVGYFTPKGKLAR